KEWDTMSNDEKPFMLFLLAGPLTSLLVFTIRVDLRITNTSFEFLVLPFRKNFRVIPMEQIQSIEVTHLTGINKLRRSGVSYRGQRREFYLGGTHVIKVKLHKGGSYLFGTSKPRELEHFLSSLPEGGPEILFHKD
ncbi:MAG: hypothetical protein J7L89_08910, partial [Bacteroidales bacterium]|nr:hypothetical protein [Bacteroidales bacterium]